MRALLLVLAVVLTPLTVWQFLKVFEQVEKGPPEGILPTLSLIVTLLVLIQVRKKDRPA